MRLKQVKIIRDDARLDERGVPRSKGFGFLHFEKPEHALAALNEVRRRPPSSPLALAGSTGPRRCGRAKRGCLSMPAC